jgi:predicted small integral membrane protein
MFEFTSRFIPEALQWMEWSDATFALFIVVIAMLTGMTIWDVRSPSSPRKGFMPIAFTRGDRLFLSIVTLIGTVVLWIAFLPDVDWRIALPVAAVLIFIVVRWG